MDLAGQSARPGWAFPLALVLLGPFLFLSIILSLLAPFATLYLHQGSPDRFAARIWALLAVPLGAAVCFMIKGPAAAVSYAVLAALPGVFLGELLDRKRPPEWAIGLASLATCLLTALLAWIFIWSQQDPPLAILRGLVKTTVLQIKEQMQSNPNMSLADSDLASFLENPDLFLLELPGIFLSAVLVLHILPSLLLIRWNPKAVCRRLGFARDYLRSYSSPEWLVWPAILSLAFLLFETPILTPIASNLLKPLLVIYFFHGMSILAYFLDSFRLRGPLRYLFYGVGLMFLTPMVVSFGFFDLWFNFRSRFETTA